MYSWKTAAKLNTYIEKLAWPSSTEICRCSKGGREREKKKKRQQWAHGPQEVDNRIFTRSCCKLFFDPPAKLLEPISHPIFVCDAIFFSSVFFLLLNYVKMMSRWKLNIQRENLCTNAARQLFAIDHLSRALSMIPRIKS